MADIKKLLAVRRLLKSKKPDFVRQQGGRVNRLPRNWRKPGGHQSKLRHKMKNRGFLVEPGWGSPAAVRGLDRSGLQPVLVHNPAQLSKLDKKTQGALVANIGDRKRLAVIETAKKLGIMLLNIKDGDKRSASIIDNLKSRKEKAEFKIKAKEDRAKKTAKKEDKKSDEKSVEEHKEEEKKEMEKVVTKKG